MSSRIAGALLQLLAHSWIAGSLFYLIGETYEVQGSRLSRAHTYYGRGSTAMLYMLLANSVVVLLALVLYIMHLAMASSMESVVH